MTKVLLNRNNLRIAGLCPKAESRYTLNALQVTRKETVTINGHYLIRVSLPAVKSEDYPQVEGHPKDSGEWESVLLPQATAKEAYKNVPKGRIPILNHAVVYKGEDGRVQVGTTDLSPNKMVDGKITGQFPNWRAVMPQQAAKFAITLSPEYLMKLAKSALEHQGDKAQPGVRLQFTTASQSVRMDCQADDGQEWTAVLMPMRDSVIENAYLPAAPEPVVDPFADVPEYEPLERAAMQNPVPALASQAGEREADAWRGTYPSTPLSPAGRLARGGLPNSRGD